MSEKTINFNDKNINKKDISKILVSKAEPYGKMNAKKYIIGYNDNVIRPLHIFFLQMNGYFKCFDDNLIVYIKLCIIRLLFMLF